MLHNSMNSEENIIDSICQDLFSGQNYQGMWHGSENWGKSADFHEHPFFVWNSIQKFLPNRKLNIVETGRATGQTTNLFSAISYQTGGHLFSFDPEDWNRNYILKINEKYGTESNYTYVVDSSLNAESYLPSDFKIDVLFLDSLHTYDLVSKETLLFEKYLNDKSIIFFHDTVWCFDAVMGWVKDYLADKNVVYAQHPDTKTPQCEHCEEWGKAGLFHGRSHMLESGRPDFQSEMEIANSPHYGSLNYDFIQWSSKSLEDALETEKLVFTNIEACCGIGALFINKENTFTQHL